MGHSFCLRDREKSRRCRCPGRDSKQAQPKCKSGAWWTSGGLHSTLLPFWLFKLASLTLWWGQMEDGWMNSILAKGFSGWYVDVLLAAVMSQWHVLLICFWWCIKSSLVLNHSNKWCEWIVNFSWQSELCTSGLSSLTNPVQFNLIYLHSVNPKQVNTLEQA
jgi:hypothetical protein